MEPEEHILMKYGLYVCNYGAYGDPNNLITIGKKAEEAGWDGIFLWDHINPGEEGVNVIDPWVGLSAIASHTSEITIGTTITPLPRRRPRKLAREAVSLDHLSNGRLILGVGIGAPPEQEFGYFNEPTGTKIRGEMLDEGLDILEGLWSGEPFKYDGQHYQITEEVTFLPKPVQQPRIPIWTGGFWDYKTYKPFRRAAGFNGCIPIMQQKQGNERLQVYKDIREYISKHRDDEEEFDLVLLDTFPKSKKEFRQTVEEFDGVVSWWLEAAYDWQHQSLDMILSNIEAGPPV